MIYWYAGGLCDGIQAKHRQVTAAQAARAYLMEPNELDKIIRATFAVLIFAAYWYGWFLPQVVKAAQP